MPESRLAMICLASIGHDTALTAGHFVHMGEADQVMATMTITHSR